ncbi:MAG TPA: hypothetical protein VGX91_13705 [Candidatus Cybelea sp.]|jgi:hypothetical protein|nr:hypothetical protein [Candidatus Cybelea sp.]
MTPLLLAAVISTGFTPDRALQVLERDDGQVAACARDDPRQLREALALKQLSRSPSLVLVTLFDDACSCFAQNCPYWVYRVNENSATKIFESVAVGVKVVPHDGAVANIDEVAHESATIKNESLYVYHNGTFERTGAWILRGDERKPVSVPIRFAPGSSSKRLSGSIGIDWADEYTLDAHAGQTLEITAAQAQRMTLVRLAGAKLDVTLRAGRAVTLPVSGRYTITVVPLEGGNGDSTYAFTISIH